MQTITEGTKTADFVYNADHLRIRMTLKTSGTTTKTRYYFGGSCEREVAGSTTTQYIWIGGDAYSAVAVAKKIGTGSWAVYNIFRDHLGTITHLKNGTNPADEYSFDAWGRRRDKDSWSYTLSGEPALFADRGFTGHEFLSDFNLYNMNGRLYDPVVGRFLSPDPFVQAPGFTQSYNRYSYCLNNPLKFTDPSGEIAWPFVWAGNWLFGGLDNWINKGMPFKQAFSVKYNPVVASANYHPSNNTWSNTQASAQNLVKQQASGMNSINQQIAGFSGGTSWQPMGFGDIINQQFVGESPLRGEVAGGVDAISSAAFPIWGEMQINSNVESNAGLFAGHGWIKLESKKGEITTMSLWRQNGDKNEFFRNIEISKGYKAIASKSTMITPQQFNLVLYYNSIPSNVDWTPWNTCVGYSSGLWNYVTSDNLSTTDYFWFTTPRSLTRSITKNP